MLRVKAVTALWSTADCYIINNVTRLSKSRLSLKDKWQGKGTPPYMS